MHTTPYIQGHKLFFGCWQMQ